MAIELIARVLSQPKDVLDASEKMVLVVMADRADQDGLLWYALGTICQLSSFERKSVQRIIGRLEAKGLVSRMQRSQQSNYYRIAVEKLPLVPIAKRPGERGLKEWIEEEPDLFGVGDPGTPRADLGGRPSDAGGRPSDASRGDLGTPDSLTDPSNDPLDGGVRTRENEPLEDSVVRRWNELPDRFEALAPFRGAMTDERKKKIAARTSEGKRVPWIEAKLNDVLADPARLVWDHVFETIGKSKLLTGQKTSWAPTFDWMLGPKNFAKIMEGNYGHGHDQIGASTNDPRDRSAVAAGREARQLVERSRQRRGNQRPGGYQGRSSSAGG